MRHAARTAGSQRPAQTHRAQNSPWACRVGENIAPLPPPTSLCGSEGHRAQASREQRQCTTPFQLPPTPSSPVHWHSPRSISAQSSCVPWLMHGTQCPCCGSGCAQCRGKLVPQCRITRPRGMATLRTPCCTHQLPSQMSFAAVLMQWVTLGWHSTLPPTPKTGWAWLPCSWWMAFHWRCGR